MAEHDLTPIEVEEGVQDTYDLLKSYFIRQNNPFNIVADFVNDDGFSIDVIRSYSFIASTHRATIHFSGTPTETGTKIGIHVKSVETAENLEKEIHDRLEDALAHMIAEKHNKPIDDDSTPDPAKEKRQLIITVVVLAVIALGAGLSAVMDQFSSTWLV